MVEEVILSEPTTEIYPCGPPDAASKSGAASVTSTLDFPMAALTFGINTRQVNWS